MIRAFVAIAIPERILAGIEVTNARLKELKLDARFTKVSSLHLTLKFLGNIDESTVAGISDVLELCAETASPFRLAIDDIGVFPSFKRPRVVWVGVEEKPMLVDLQDRVETNLESLGFAADKRRFRPHLTLARMKSLRNLSELQGFLESEGEAFKSGSFEVSEIHLFQSILRPDGAVYRRLSTHPLGMGRSTG